LVRQLSAAGQPVRAVARNSADAAILKQPNLELDFG